MKLALFGSVFFPFTGGTFALYSLLCRNLNVGILSSKRVDSNSSLSHINPFEGSEKRSRLGKFIERSVVARRVLLFIAMLGMCMLIGDGILTPAISGKIIKTFCPYFCCLVYILFCSCNSLFFLSQCCQLWMV